MERTVAVVATGLGFALRWLLLGVQAIVLAFPVACVLYGVYLIYVPAVWILGGLVAGFLLYRPRGKR